MTLYAGGAFFYVRTGKHGGYEIAKTFKSNVIEDTEVVFSGNYEECLNELDIIRRENYEVDLDI